MFNSQIIKSCVATAIQSIHSIKQLLHATFTTFSTSHYPSLKNIIPRQWSLLSLLPLSSVSLSQDPYHHPKMCTSWQSAKRALSAPATPVRTFAAFHSKNATLSSRLFVPPVQTGAFPKVFLCVWNVLVLATSVASVKGMESEKLGDRSSVEGLLQHFWIQTKKGFGFRLCWKERPVLQVLEGVVTNTQEDVDDKWSN
jgi:hypothetical protein